MNGKIIAVKPSEASLGGSTAFEAALWLGWVPLPELEPRTAGPSSSRSSPRSPPVSAGGTAITRARSPSRSRSGTSSPSSSRGKIWWARITFIIRSLGVKKIFDLKPPRRNLDENAEALQIREVGAESRYTMTMRLFLRHRFAPLLAVALVFLAARELRADFVLDPQPD